MTAGTYQKIHYFLGKERLDVLHRGLLKVCSDAGWNLQAWGVFPNHYEKSWLARLHYVHANGGAPSTGFLLHRLS